MKLKIDDIVWLKFKDHSMNFGELVEVDLVGFIEDIAEDYITVVVWKSHNPQAENESFTIGWGLIDVIYKLEVG